MAKEMLINVSEGEECRIALLDGGRLEELYMERTSSTSHVGNIYKGRVTNVEPSIQAAFVDFGLGRNGFLHISDLMPTYFGRKGEDIQETVGRKMARRDRPPIQRCLRRGDEIIVQIIKEGIGTKGPTLSTYLSIPGRILVMMPGMGKMGVSRKIEDDEERRRLRQILDSLEPPEDVGFIIRTAGVGKTKAEIQRDLTYLTRLWTIFKKKSESGSGPMELYTEGDLVTRTVRDVFSSDVERIVIDNKEVAKRVKEVVKLSNPRTRNRVELYEEPIPLFHKYGIEREIEQIYSRHVPLPSGGSLVIDSTEAIVAIDVNSGKFREHADAETTAFKTDMEAADEIPRQLKLRDLGGVIICDFIDLRYERHRRELEKRLHDHLQNDRAKTKVLRMSQFGIIEMTRQRMRPSLKRSIYFDCPHCKGAGLVKTPESMSLDVMRRLAIAINDQRVARVELTICAEVNFHLQNKKRQGIAALEEKYGKKVIVRADQAFGLDEVKLELFDNRDGLVQVEELGVSAALPHTTQLGPRPARNGGRGRFGDRRPPQRQGPRGGQPAPAARRDEEEDRFDIDSVEDAVEEREEQIDAAAEHSADAASVQGPASGREPAQMRGPVVVRAPLPDNDSDDARDAGDDEFAGEDSLADDEHGDNRDRGARQDAPVIGQAANRNGGEFRGDESEGGGHRKRRRRRRRGRGGNGGNRENFDRGGTQPQEQAVGGGGYEDEYDTGEDDRPDPGNQRNEPRRPQSQPQARHEQRDRAPQRDDRGQRDRQPPVDRNDQRNRDPRQQPVGSGGNRGYDNRNAPARGNENRGPEMRGNEPQPAGEGEGQGGRRRRRRRRGRRGRGRGGMESGTPQGQPAFAGGPGGQRPEDNFDREASEGLGEAPELIGADRDQEDVRQEEQFAASHDPESREPDRTDEAAEEERAPAVEAAEAVEEAPAPKRSRRARAGTGRSRSRAKAPAETAAPAEASPADEGPAEDAGAKPAPRRRRPPAKKSRGKAAAKDAGEVTASAGSPVPPPEPAPRTGSTDRHLVDDEPIAPQPVIRPRSYRDLDAIPDDFD